MSKFLVVYKRQNLKTKMKENLFFVLNLSKFNQKNAEKEFLKISPTIDKNYTLPKFSYHRPIIKTLELPKLNIWKPIVILRKNAKYYIATWHRYTNNVSEYFHLIIPSSKANPNDGTAEFNKLNNLDIGYPVKKRNTELEISDKSYFKYWKSSSAMYQIGVELFENLENLPDILNHWYEVKEVSDLYPQWGFSKKNVTLKIGAEELTKDDIKVMMQFAQSGSSVNECVDYMKKSLKERPKMRKLHESISKPIKIKLSKKLKKNIQKIFKDVFKDEDLS